MKHAIKLIVVSTLLAGTTLAISSCGSATGTPVASSGVKPYPLKTCLITDNDLGSMGDEQRIVYKGQEIKFCCKPCETKFLKNPDKYLQKLNNA